MPNWCSNILEIIGDKETLKLFRKAAIGFSPWEVPGDQKPDVLNFHSLMPIPAEVIRAGYDKRGYAWETAHWGCKWGACRPKLFESKPTRITYTFDTAWLPPLEFLEHISKDWPSFVFRIEFCGECGDFAGEATITNGHLRGDRV
jgi:hypothetical protein